MYLRIPLCCKVLIVELEPPQHTLSELEPMSVSCIYQLADDTRTTKHCATLVLKPDKKWRQIHKMQARSSPARASNAKSNALSGEGLGAGFLHFECSGSIVERQGIRLLFACAIAFDINGFRRGTARHAPNRCFEDIPLLVALRDRAEPEVVRQLGSLGCELGNELGTTSAEVGF